ncbi:MAG: glycosyltransferase [Chitinophagales bacterium]|nr:glycosyltransferase [Hyphomicrobiales bacterium]
MLESDDREMIAAVARTPLQGNVDVIVVPSSHPQTKPKALNYALQFATGDYVVVFDAEDQPDRDQLRKAATMFASLPPQVVCLQARLVYHNHSENWLSKQFAIEYASLFGGVLPMLDAMALPLPLGGTSNHFRIEALRGVGAWDAFNVTEDADLGMRLYRAGLRCKTLDSNTWEEAACQPMNWLKQRSRWLKGWMQTYGVHMRRPVRAWRELGWRGFIAFQGHFASVILSALAHPLVYVLLIADGVNGHVLRAPESFLGEQFMLLAAFNFAAGYFCTLGLGLATLKARGLSKLIPHLVFVPLYWMLISVAAYRALYQLITAPFHWDKTDHGVSGLNTTPATK